MKHGHSKRHVSLALAAAMILSNGVSAMAIETTEAEPSPAAKYTIYPNPQEMTMGSGTLQLTPTITVVTEGDEISDNTIERAKRVFKGHTLEKSTTPSPTNTNLYLDVYASGDPDGKNDVTAEASALLKSGEDPGEMSKNGQGTYGRYDNHVIHVDDKIVVYGLHENAVYYGLASIEQMLEQSPENQLLKVDINDYAHTKWRGVIEGFYGIAYSREDIINFMEWGEKYKMNTFMYGPKGDPYHLSRWREHYPQQLTEAEIRKGMLTEQDIRDITDAGKKHGISFTWTIHPMMQRGIDLEAGTSAGTWQDTDAFWKANTSRPGMSNMHDGLKAIIDKYAYMYGLGVRQFGLFVDDIDGGMAERCSVQQRRLLEEVQYALQNDDRARYDGDTDLSMFSDINPNTFYVPTKYGLSMVGPSDNNLKELKNLDSKVKDNIVIMYTGADVWSSLNNAQNVKMTEQIDRKPMMWWNEPCNDDAFARTYLGPLDQCLPPVEYELFDVNGVMSNPMCESEASKVTVGSMLDFDWNMKSFEDEAYFKQSWEAAIRSMFPKEDSALADAFFVFAKHSEPHHMDDDYANIREHARAISDDLAINGELTAQSAAAKTALVADFQSLVSACDKLIEELPNHELSSLQNLYSEELKPWIKKAKSMAEIGLAGFELLEKNSGNYADAYDTYYKMIDDYAQLSTSDEFAIYPMRGAGDQTHELGKTVVSVGGRTFNRLLDTLKNASLEHYKKLLDDAQATVLKNVETDGLTLSDENDVATLSASKEIVLNKGDYIGLSVNELQANGLQATMPEGLTAQYSTNGKTWTALTKETDLLDHQASAVRYINLGKDPVTVATGNSIVLTRYKVPEVIIRDGSTGQITASPNNPYQTYIPEKAVDGNFNTFFWWGMSPAQNDEILIKLPERTTVEEINLYMGDPSRMDPLDKGATVQLSQNGATWVDIAYLNKDGREGNHVLATPKEGKQIEETEGVQNIKIPNTSNVITEAQYVRVLITESFSHWLRVREIFVNSPDDLEAKVPTTTLRVQGSRGLNLMLDNRLDTYMQTTTGMISGSAINLEYPKAVNANNIQLVFGETDGSLTAKAKVSVSTDGKAFTELGILNETFTAKAENGHQIFTIDSKVLEGKNVSQVKYLRVEFSENQNSALKVYRVALNGAAQANWENSVDNNNNYIKELFDRDASVAYRPAAAGSVQVTLPTSEKLDKINVLTKADTMPNFEVMADGTWSPITAAQSGDKKYVLDVSALLNVTDVRMSYADGNLPNIFEVTTTSHPYTDDHKDPLIEKITAAEAKLATMQDGSESHTKLKTEVDNAYALINKEISAEAATQQVQKLEEAMNTGSSGGGSGSGGGGSSSGGSVVSKYDVKLNQNKGGSIKADRTSASAGSSVTVTATPDNGFKVDKIVITDSRSNKIAYSTKDAGTFVFKMPSSNVTVDVTFAANSGSNTGAFEDVQADAWYQTAVEYVNNKGLMVGTDATHFSPNMTTTRAMIVSILWRLDGEKSANAAANFTDVPADAWYAKAVAWASEKGIVAGYENGKFGPNDIITREQLASILYRYAGKPETKGSISNFTDSSKVNAYAVPALSWAVENGLISGMGNGTLAPQAGATRAQAALVFMNFIENILK